jgi:hypothetical protein
MMELYLCAIFDAQDKSKAANLHANKATQTKEYKRMPSKLGLEIVNQIKESVRANKMAATESVLEKHDARRWWWEFWK